MPGQSKIFRGKISTDTDLAPNASGFPYQNDSTSDHTVLSFKAFLIGGIRGRQVGTFKQSNVLSVIGTTECEGASTFGSYIVNSE
jgi:hypothetical protein